MMAPGFKPVGWVAAVAGSAIVCYMLSLNVASERAELLRIEREIVETKQAIRGLQTELGTRGRLAQLEQWNADVLALSAPTTGQFLDTEVKLARFDRTQPSLDDRAEVRLASADAAAEPANKIEAPVLQAAAPAVPPVSVAVKKPANPLLRQASLSVPAPKLVTSSPLAVTQRSAKPATLAKQTKSADTERVSSKAAKTGAVAPAAKPVRTASASSAAKPPKLGPPAQLLPVLPTAPAKAPKAAAPQGRQTSRIDSGLAQQIATAAKLEASSRGR